MMVRYERQFVSFSHSLAAEKLNALFAEGWSVEALSAVAVLMWDGIQTYTDTLVCAVLVRDRPEAPQHGAPDWGRLGAAVG